MDERLKKTDAKPGRERKKDRMPIFRVLRVVSVFFALAAALVVVAALILANRPEMLGLGETLTAKVSEATGLDCRADGPIEVGIFPAPYIQIYRVTLFAPAGGKGGAQSHPAADAPHAVPTPAAVNATFAANATAFGPGPALSNATRSANATALTAPAPEKEETPAPLLTLSAVRVELSPLPLLWGEIELRLLKLFDPVLDLDALRAMNQPSEGLVFTSAGGAVFEAIDSKTTGQTAPLSPGVNATAAPRLTAVNTSANATAAATPEGAPASPGQELEAAPVYDQAELARLLDMLLNVEISGGVVFERGLQDEKAVLASAINLASDGDDLTLSLRSHALASPRDSASMLELRLRNLSVDNGRIKTGAEVTAALNTLGQSLRPEIRAGLSYDPVRQNLEIADFFLAMEKLRISGQFTAGFSNGEFSVAGHLEHAGLSLPRWFQFGRNLPGSLQYALDDISGSMDFDLNQDRLEVERMVTRVLGMTLTGRGGTPDFAAPVVVIEGSGPFLDVNALFPEVVDPPPAELPRVHYADPPLVGGEDVDDSDLPEVGHDIIITGKTAQVRKLKVDNLEVRIVPSPRGTQCKFDLGGVAGGKMKADLTVLSGTDKIEIDAELANLAVQTLGQDLFERAPLVAQVGGKARVTAIPDTLSVFFRSMDLDFALKFGPGSLYLRETKRKLVFDSVTASGQGASTPGQDGSDSMLGFAGHWDFLAVSGKEKLKATLKGPLGVDEKTLDLATSGGEINATANAELGFLGLTAKHEVKFSGHFAYDDRARTLNLRKAAINLPYGTAAGDIACKEQGFPAEAWNGAIVLNLPSVRNWLEYMGFDRGAFPEQGLNKGVFTFKFEQGGQKWAIKDVDIFLDEKTKGRLNLSQAGDKSYAFSLNLDAINMDDYYPSRKTSSALPSPKPWDLSGLMKMRAKGDIAIKDLTWRKLHYTDVAAQLTLENAKLHIPASAAFYGGRTTSELKATLEPGRLNAQFSLDFKGAQLGGVTHDLYTDERASGLMNISLLGSGAPSRASEVLTAFSGQWAFDVGAGYFRGKRDEATGKEPSKTQFSAIRASGRMHDGRLETDNFTLSAPGSTDTLGRGHVDIARDTIEMDFDVRMLGIDVPVRLAGPLDSPETTVKSGKLIGNAVGGIGSGLFGLVVDVITLPGKVIMLPFGKEASGGGAAGKDGGAGAGGSSQGGAGSSGSGAGGSGQGGLGGSGDSGGRSSGAGGSRTWGNSGANRH